MKKITDYFTPENGLNLVDAQKTKAFLIFNAILFGVLFMLFAQSIFVVTASSSLNHVLLPSVGLFLLINLFILKKYGIRHAGNILTTGTMLAVAVAVSNFDMNTPVVIKYTQGFYLFLAILVIGGLFTSRKILLLNVLIVLITTNRTYFFTLEQAPEKINIFTSAYIFHTLSLIVILAILITIINFSRNAIAAANEDARVNKKQSLLLLQMISGIKKGSAEIYQVSSQLSSVSQQIAQNANEQAATTEEIASSIEEMFSMISENTGNAEITEKITEESANEMKVSHEVFSKTVNSVSAISEKIAIISEIAGKTDILSINAAIEAARSGEVGRGFGVVADEIRKLADKTKIASDEINNLSNSGKDISKEARDNLEEIIPKVLKSAMLVNNISEASKKQENGMKMINISIQELATITNRNSASSEEMFASAEELTAAAEELKKLIAHFKIEE